MLGLECRVWAHADGATDAIHQDIDPAEAFGRLCHRQRSALIRFEDDAIRRIVLRQERLVAAIPSKSRLAQGEGAVSLSDLAEEPLIIYPRHPRPSYADQVIRLFHDHGLDPRVLHEAREIQIALGLVAAEEGICIVPESVQKSQLDGVTYRDLVEPASSPIMPSAQAGHSPRDLAHLEAGI